MRSVDEIQNAVKEMIEVFWREQTKFLVKQGINRKNVKAYTIEKLLAAEETRNLRDPKKQGVFVFEDFEKRK